MKHENPIEEIWRIRDKLGAEEGYDVHRLFERLRQEEKKYGDRLVRVVPRRAPSCTKTRPRATDGSRPAVATRRRQAADARQYDAAKSAQEKSLLPCEPGRLLSRIRRICGICP
jgi:hypothetical protein